MISDGTFYLSRNNSRLYLGKTESTFYFYHLDGNDKYLKILYQALPSFPLSYVKNTSWQDIIPSKFLKGFENSLSNMLFGTIKYFFSGYIRTNAKYHFATDTVIQGDISTFNINKKIQTSIHLDPYLKFKTIEVGSYKLVSNVK